MQILGYLAGIVALVCWVIVLIKMFNKSAVLGIVGIATCGLVAFIWGWAKAGEEKLMKVMLAWTVCIILLKNLVFILLYSILSTFSILNAFTILIPVNISFIASVNSPKYIKLFLPYFLILLP